MLRLCTTAAAVVSMASRTPAAAWFFSSWSACVPVALAGVAAAAPLGLAVRRARPPVV